MKKCYLKDEDLAEQKTKAKCSRCKNNFRSADNYVCAECYLKGFQTGEFPYFRLKDHPNDRH